MYTACIAAIVADDAAVSDIHVVADDVDASALAVTFVPQDRAPIQCWATVVAGNSATNVVSYPVVSDDAVFDSWTGVVQINSRPAPCSGLTSGFVCSHDREVLYQWRVIEGTAQLRNTDAEIVTFKASSDPGLVQIGLTATEGDRICEATGLVTVTETLVESTQPGGDNKQGLPAYSFQRAAGELWRSRFELDRNLIIVNSGHRDFVYASKTKALKLRYICRLYAKELVLKNFPGLRPDELLERMIEISLYTEENLR